MSARALAFVGAVASGMLLAAGAFGLFAEIPNDKPFKSDAHPAELVELINQHRRVYGWAGDEGIHLFFRGDTAKLNEFLSRLSKLKNAWLEVTLFPDPGRARTRKVSFTGPDGIDRANRPFLYNWHLSARKLPALKLESGQTLEQALAAGKRPRLNWGKGRWLITVAVSVHGDIDLGDIRLPLEFYATVGGRLGRFVDWHNERRSSGRTGKATTRDSRPSALRLMAEPSPFGDPSQDATDQDTRERMWKTLRQLLERGRPEEDLRVTSQPLRP